MIALSEKQRRILEYLLDHPAGATLDELSVHLEISKSATKEHLIKIDSAGYLAYTDSKGEIGRPRRHYSLSTRGTEVFPKQYAWLSNVLLELLSEDLGGQRVSRIMKKLADRIAKTMEARFRGKESSRELFEEITRALNELGYRAFLRQSDIRKGAVIEATNCVYHSVARDHPELCQFDTQFMRNASGMDVTLETCIAKGGSVCRFCFRKSRSEARGGVK